MDSADCTASWQVNLITLCWLDRSLDVMQFAFTIVAMVSDKCRYNTAVLLHRCMCRKASKALPPELATVRQMTCTEVISCQPPRTKTSSSCWPCLLPPQPSRTNSGEPASMTFLGSLCTKAVQSRLSCNTSLCWLPFADCICPRPSRWCAISLHNRPACDRPALHAASRHNLRASAAAQHVQDNVLYMNLQVLLLEQ